MCRWAGKGASWGCTIRSGSCSRPVISSVGVRGAPPGRGYRSATAGSHASRNHCTNRGVSAVPTMYPTARPYPSSSTRVSSGSWSTYG